MKIAGLILLYFLILLPTTVRADFNITTDSTTITADNEILAHVTLNLQGQANKQYFLEAAIKKDGSSNYFGQTWNDNDWVKYSSSNFSNLKSITTDDQGKWGGDIRAKLDTSSNLFTGNGNYIFQLKRFTSAGSSSYSDNSVTLAVAGA